MEGGEFRSVVVAKAVVRAVASGLGKTSSEGCGGFGSAVVFWRWKRVRGWMEERIGWPWELWRLVVVVSCLWVYLSGDFPYPRYYHILWVFVF